MSAPERIWVHPRDFIVGDVFEVPSGSDDTPYIRADIHEAAVREAERSARLEERARCLDAVTAVIEGCTAKMMAGETPDIHGNRGAGAMLVAAAIRKGDT